MDREEAIRILEKMKTRCFPDELKRSIEAGKENEAIDFALVDMKICEANNSGWVSVKSRLPEEGETVLVWNDEGFCYVDEIKNGKWRIPGDYAGNTHWMPLPNPPEDA